MQLTHERGAAVAPEPSKEPYREPSTAAHRRETQTAAEGKLGSGGLVSEFFAVLGDAWRLTEAQRARLAPAVKAALDMGWTPRTLVSVTGTNTTVVRNPYAVLASCCARRTARAADAIDAATVVRRLRPGDPDARLPRRHATSMPAVQADKCEGRHDHTNTSAERPRTGAARRQQRLQGPCDWRLACALSRPMYRITCLPPIDS